MSFRSKFIISIVVAIVAAIAILFIISQNKMNKLVITTTEFKNGERMPVEYTCDGDDANPPFAISAIPQGTQSLAIIVEDPDASVGVWVHWVKWNIPVSIPVTTIDDKKEPGGVSGSNSSGSMRYEGPCPGNGKVHRYLFKFFALDTELDLLEGSTAESLKNAMEGHILTEGNIMATYDRNVR